MAQQAAHVNSTPDDADRRHIPGWVRTPAGVALILAVVFAALTFASSVGDIGRPFGGFLSYGYFNTDVAGVVYETPDWWMPMATGLLEHGDDLVAVNGRPYTPHARQEFERAYAAGQPVTLLVKAVGNGQQREVVVPAQLFTVADYLDVKLPDVLVAVSFWLLALMILRARPDAITNQVFATVAACIALHRVSAHTAVFVGTELLANVPRVGLSIAAGLIGPLLFHMAFVFPTPVQRQPRWLFIIFYIVGAASGMVLAVTRVPLWAAVPQELAAALDFGSYVVMMYLLLVGTVTLFVRLIWSSLRERQTPRQRRVGGIITAGLLFALPAVAIILAPIFYGFDDTLAAFWQGLDLRYMMLSIPIAFAYVIIRYQTFQGVSRLFIFVIVLSLSGMLAAIGTWSWRLWQPVDATALHPPFVALFSLILLASLVWSSQASWRGWFGRYLHWEQHSYDAARAFGDRIMGKTNLQEIPQAMAEALADELALERAAVWLWQPSQRAFVLAAGAGASEPPLPPRLEGPGDGAPLTRHALRSHIADLTPPWLRPLAGEARIEAVVPLVAGAEPVGLLGLGPRWDEEVFDDRDLDVAELVGQQATLFVLAAMQIEELRRVPDQVAQAQERERLRLAGELHDTIQQFLGRLPFFLAVSRDLSRTDPAAASAILDRCLDDLEENAAMLRGIRVSLAPNQLETSLARPLQGLVAHVQQRVENLTVEFSAPPDLDAGTTTDTRHALYRVIQQALDNAVLHAEASHIDVSLDRVDGRVQFAVHDNGRGSTAAERQAAETQGSFGLKSMQARVERCGGVFDFSSEPGRGTTVSGWVPAAEAARAAVV